MLDLRVTGGTVVSSSISAPSDIGVRDGEVVGIYAPGAAPTARETVDASGLLVLPGVVDGHFHCFEPGHSEREDFDSGTQAAAAGGATTILEMPISTPGVHNRDVLRERRRIGELRTHVDFGLYGGGGADAVDDIRGMAEEGAVGYKIFLYGAPPGREIEFKGLSAVGSGDLYRSLRAVKETGLPAAIHCEDADLIALLVGELRAQGDVAGDAHERSRPDFVEAIAVSKVLHIAEAVGSRIHFPHISSGRALSMISDAKRRGLPVTIETCPHYLFGDESALDTLGPYAKINPPLRPKCDPAALWAGVKANVVDIIASDHAPYTPAEKEVGWTDIFAASAGAPSVETMGPAVWDKAIGGEITFGQAVRLLSERPAQIFGLSNRKGFLRPGSDADFLLFDPSGHWTVKTDEMLSRSKGSARLFEGRTFQGKLRATYVRGQLAFREGTILNDPGFGRFVRPE